MHNDHSVKSLDLPAIPVYGIHKRRVCNPEYNAYIHAAAKYMVL